MNLVQGHAKYSLGRKSYLGEKAQKGRTFSRSPYSLYWILAPTRNLTTGVTRGRAIPHINGIDRLGSSSPVVPNRGEIFPWGKFWFILVFQGGNSGRAGNINIAVNIALINIHVNLFF